MERLSQPVLESRPLLGEEPEPVTPERERTVGFFFFIGARFFCRLTRNLRTFPHNPDPRGEEIRGRGGDHPHGSGRNIYDCKHTRAPLFPLAPAAEPKNET